MNNKNKKGRQLQEQTANGKVHYRKDDSGVWAFQENGPFLKIFAGKRLHIAADDQIQKVDEGVLNNGSEISKAEFFDQYYSLINRLTVITGHLKIYSHTPIKDHKCKVCGCTQQDCRQCIEKTGGPCYWVAEDLCSACEPSKPKL